MTTTVIPALIALIPIVVIISVIIIVVKVVSKSMNRQQLVIDSLQEIKAELEAIKEDMKSKND